MISASDPSKAAIQYEWHTNQQIKKDTHRSIDFEMSVTDHLTVQTKEDQVETRLTVRNGTSASDPECVAQTEIFYLH